jgi:hypothetical protein
VSGRAAGDFAARLIRRPDMTTNKTAAKRRAEATPLRERVFVYWPTVPAPKPGDEVTLDDGRRAVVETANFDAERLHRRKLVVLIQAADGSDDASGRPARRASSGSSAP